MALFNQQPTPSKIVVERAGLPRLAEREGSFNVLRLAAQRVRDSGRIISLSSSITQLRSPTYDPYAATKDAQEMLANVLAKSWRSAKYPSMP